MALALTGETPFDGNASRAMGKMVEDCHECNTHLSVVMSVIWHRLQSKTSMPILMALHLLTNLISEGPMTAIIEALDGAGKIHELKSFSDAKNFDANHEVRLAADLVYGMLVDFTSLFSRRRRIAASKAQQLTAIPTNQKMWANYLLGRLPFTTEARKLHALFRPNGSGLTYYDAGASVAPSVAASNTPSIMALARMRLVASKSSALHLGESEQLFGSTTRDSYSVPEGYMMPWETPPAEEWSSSESDNDGEETVEDEIFSAEELVSELVQPPLPTIDGFSSSDKSTDMLARFNYAVSSHGGSSCRSVSHAGTSQFGSERSGSPPPHYTRGAMTMGSTNEMTPGYSFHERNPGDIIRMDHETDDVFQNSQQNVHPAESLRKLFLT